TSRKNNVQEAYARTTKPFNSSKVADRVSDRVIIVDDVSGSYLAPNDRVLERLFELKNQDRYLRPADFADLGLLLNTLGECVEHFHRLGLAEAKVHRSSRDDRGVEFFTAKLTADGCKEFERDRVRSSPR